MRVRATESAGKTPHLTPGAVYPVVGLDHNSYRVINDNEEPVMYGKDTFEIVDAKIPDDWVWERFADDEYYASPPELASRGFYEDWFDRVPAAQESFERYLIRSGFKAR